MGGEADLRVPRDSQRRVRGEGDAPRAWAVRAWWAAERPARGGGKGMGRGEGEAGLRLVSRGFSPSFFFSFYVLFQIFSKENFEHKQIR